MNIPETSKPIRTFVALPLEKALCLELHNIQKQLQATLSVNVARWTHPEQIHLTLHFYGNVLPTQLAELTAALQRIAQATHTFSLHLNRIGCFPNVKNPRIIWVGLAGDLEELHQLQRQIRETTGHYGDHSETKPFQPHLTIGRINDPRARGLAKLDEAIQQAQGYAEHPWAVKELVLMQSQLSPQGARYTELASPALTQPAPIHPS